MEFKIGDKIKYIDDESVFIIDEIKNNYAYGYDLKNAKVKCCIKKNKDIDYNNFIINSYKHRIYENGSIIESLIIIDKPRWKFVKNYSFGASGT